MRNTTNCRRLDSNEDYFSTNPLSIHHHHHNLINKSLAALDIICEGGGALNSLQHAAAGDDHDYMQTCLQHSLHLKSLVEDYLEPSSAHSTSQSQPNLFHSKYYPHADTPYKDDKSFIHELRTIILQNEGNDHVELITREVMRATEKEEISMMHSDSAHGTPLSTLMVLGHLRKMGYNAAICTSKREKDHHKNQHKGHYFPAEEYEYMDVIVEKGSNSQVHQRLIIDLRFRSAFEIARPSTAYVELIKVVPLTYVGSPRVLQKILKLLSEAMENSFKSQGMPLPPWRKVSFLTSKWLSPTYSRSIFASPPPHTTPIPTTKMSSSNSISIKREKALSTISTKREMTLSTKRETFSSISTKSEKALYSISTHKETLPKRETFSPISIKRENALSPISAKRETLSPISSKRENALSSTNMPSFSILSKRENSLFVINNLAPNIATKRILLKHVLKSFNLTTHILPSSNRIVKNNSNKKLTNQNVKPPRESWHLPPLSNPSTSNQNVKPSREPWQLSPLPNPPPSLKKQLVGALTLALHHGSNSISTTMSGSFNNV